MVFEELIWKAGKQVSGIFNYNYMGLEYDVDLFYIFFGWKKGVIFTSESHISNRITADIYINDGSRSSLEKQTQTINYIVQFVCFPQVISSC